MRRLFRKFMLVLCVVLGGGSLIVGVVSYWLHFHVAIYSRKAVIPFTGKNHRFELSADRGIFEARLTCPPDGSWPDGASWTWGQFQFFKGNLLNDNITTGMIKPTDIFEIYYELYLPFYAPALLFATPLLIAFVGGPLRRHLRHRKGLCRNCGYNLTGLPEPRCPECGTPFGPSVAPSLK